MGCAIKKQNYKSFNHDQILQQILTAFRSTKFIPLQTFETNFMCAQTYLQQYTFKQYSRPNNTKPLLARFTLFLLCNRYTIYQQGFYGSIQRINHQTFKSISKDVHRTYPDEPYFKIQQNIQKFQRVLKHIAIYFPQHGYTQGINFIVGFLLLQGATQQQSFWMFVNLALNHKFAILGLYQQSFPLAELYYHIFYKLLQKYFPQLHHKLNQNYIPKECWIFQWFLTFFSYSFPLEVSMIFWEYILVNGSYSMIYLSLGLIKQIEQKLLELEDDVRFCQFFQKLKDKQILLQTIKDINFKNIFNFAQKLKHLQINIEQFAKSCPLQSRYKKLCSKSEEQKIKETKLYKILLDEKRNIYFANPANHFIKHFPKQKSSQNLKKNFHSDVSVHQFSGFGKKHKEDLSTILDSKNIYSDDIEKENSFNF